MRQLPVVVVLRSQFSHVAMRLGLAFLLLVTGVTMAEHHTDALPEGFVARINQNSPIEVLQVLRQIEQFQQSSAQSLPPIVIVVHGPEVAMFYRQNYLQYAEIVDLSEKLTADGALDIRVCQTSASALMLDAENLYPFASSVPFGPAEINRLLGVEGYSPF